MRDRRVWNEMSKTNFKNEVEMDTRLLVEIIPQVQKNLYWNLTTLLSSNSAHVRPSSLSM